MKKFQIIFLIFVSALVIFPSINIDYKTVTSEREKRDFVVFPKIILDGSFNKNFSRQLNSYFEDRIGFKYQFKRVFEKLNKFYQMENSLEKQGIYGKDDWLFYNKDNLYKTFSQLYPEEKVAFYTKKLKDFQDWCESNGIKFIYYIAPNKDEIYDEFYPFSRPSGKTLTDQLVESFLAEGVNVIYPKEFLRASKKNEKHPIYLERDSHWNYLGAYYGSIPLVQNVKNLFSNISFPELSYKFHYKRIRGGDLENILGTPKGEMTQYDFTTFISGAETQSAYTYVKNEGHDGITTCGRKDLPKLLMFRDSFTIALEPFISPYFSSAEYVWHYPTNEDKSYILSQKPDLLIFESVERMVPEMLDNDFQN